MGRCAKSCCTFARQQRFVATLAEPEQRRATHHPLECHAAYGGARLGLCVVARCAWSRDIVAAYSGIQAQLAAMRSQADEVKRINTTPLVVTTNARTLADTIGLQIAFGQNNTATTANTTVTINERRQFRVNIASIAYTSWLDNLDAALKRYRVRVVSVNLKPLQPGNSAALMAVELVLADDAPSGR